MNNLLKYCAVVVCLLPTLVFAEAAFSKELAAGGVEALVIEWDNGQVTLKPAVGAGFTIEATPYAEGLNIIPNGWLDYCSFTIEDGTLKLIFDKDSRERGLGVDLVVGLPKAVSVEIASGNGDVVVENETKSLDLALGNGDAYVKEVTGDVEVALGNGNLELHPPLAYIGQIVIEHGNGDCYVDIDEAFTGGISIDMGNGDIIIEMAEAYTGLNLDAASATGEVECDIPGARVEDQFIGQSVELAGAGPRIEAAVGNGDIEINLVN